MGYRIRVYRHHGSLFFAIFALLLTGIVIFLLVGATEVAFQRLGFSRLQVVLILVGTFVGVFLTGIIAVILV